MRVFKESPLLLIWLVLLTIAVVYSLYHVNVTINVQSPENAKVSVQSTSSTTFGGKK